MTVSVATCDWFTEKIINNMMAYRPETALNRDEWESERKAMQRDSNGLPIKR